MANTPTPSTPTPGETPPSAPPPSPAPAPRRDPGRPGPVADLRRSIGFDPLRGAVAEQPAAQQIEFINMKLAALGEPIYGEETDYPTLEMSRTLLAAYREKNRILADHLCPVDQRIQDFLDSYLAGAAPAGGVPRLPSRTFVLDRHGLARTLSLPADGDSFQSSIISSYRIRQGVLHNPANDRRTTQGVFHVTEGGLPVPADKKAVPVATFGHLLAAALDPPEELLQLPFTAGHANPASLVVSLLLRPTVVPALPGIGPARSMEVRFFAPGNLVSNLDFVESIFGNAGDPLLAENDAGLDAEGWTGHTGCVILAPHLTTLTKREVGLPHGDEATDRQRRDGMFWTSPEEIYNDGGAFKITARDARGVMVTVIADNYFGYCKKEVKTQISYAANLLGNTEEEHAGGALTFPSYDLGDDFHLSTYLREVDHTFADLVERHGEAMDLRPGGYGVDRTWPDIVYLPETVHIVLHEQRISWTNEAGPQELKLLAGKTYVLPSGYKVEMVKLATTGRWRLIGTRANGTHCHKPCTVSGGGKSEISKSIADAIINGPVFVRDLEKDFDQVEEILRRDYGDRFRKGETHFGRPRPILSPERSHGSVIKLLYPSHRFTDAYNAWLETIPSYIKELVLVVKRFYRSDWEDGWRRRFHVDTINGVPGNILKYRDLPLVTQYLRVGYTEDGDWRTFGLRKDFNPAAKIQQEDDISAAAVVPAGAVAGLSPDYDDPSVKFLQNCEFRLFQRPDDAIVRGYDAQAEADLSRPGSFLSNYEPLGRDDAVAMLEDILHFDRFTAPMKDLIQAAAEGSVGPAFFASSAHPRLVDGRPTKNPRYLQTRPDLLARRDVYLAELGARLYRRLPPGDPVPFPVNAVLPGRRNNPPDPEAGVRPLAVHSPIHYLDLPELFMEFIASMTGKSPSTTGAGSEGALTKAPFNALPPVHDLNAALVSFIVTGYDGFLTAAGYVGPKFRVAHDVSLLVPEVWSRMSVAERKPAYLLEMGFLEKIEDFEHAGQNVLASRLGFRITDRFVNAFFGRIFSNPGSVFTEEMLKPELQDMDVFADGMDNMVATHRRVAELYFEDGSVEQACPPLRALLEIMREDPPAGGAGLADPDFRALFDRQAVLASDWYRRRLEAKQQVDVRLWGRHVASLQHFLEKPSHRGEAERLGVADRLARARSTLEHCEGPAYLEELSGTLGADPALAP